MVNLPFYLNKSLSDLHDQELDDEGSDSQNTSCDYQTDRYVITHLFERRKRDKREILICHLNVNSLQNKVEELKCIKSQLKAQVLMLTETKIDKSYSNEQFAWTGYDILRKDRKKGGGGILMYVDESLQPKNIKPLRKYVTVEMLAVQIKIDREIALLIGMYRPPKNSGDQYFQKLEDELHEIRTWATMQHTNVIIGGDLNLDRSKPRIKEGKLLVDLEEVYGLSCLIKEPTRITANSQTLIDVFLTNKPELHQTSGSFDPGISDHNMIYSLMTKKTQFHKSKVITFRSKKNLDSNKFIQDLEQAPWQVGDIFESVDDQYHYWQTLFSQVVNEHMPLKRMRVRDTDVPYMTTQWKKAIRMKRRFARRFSKHRTDENFELKKKWRNEATKQRRIAVKQYWNEKASELKSRPSEFFKTFKPFLSGRKEQESNRVLRMEIEGKIQDNPQIVGDNLVLYFSNMGDNGKGSVTAT